jgi:hypothetical protein
MHHSLHLDLDLDHHTLHQITKATGNKARISGTHAALHLNQSRIELYCIYSYRYYYWIAKVGGDPRATRSSSTRPEAERYR